MPGHLTMLTTRNSERQYKYRFHRLKNVSEEDYGDIDDECRRRAAIGKETVVYLHGRPLPLDRLKRGIDRVQKNRPKRQVAKRKDNDPGRITFRTPSPAPVPISNRATPQLRDPQTSRTAQGLRIVSTTKSPMLLGSPSGASQQQPSQRVIGPDDVGIDTTVDLGDATRKSQSDISTEAVNWPQRTVSLAGGLEPDHRATTHARHSSPSAQEAVSLHRGGADLHLSSPDTHHDRTLMSNLPFFRLLHEIGQPGIVYPAQLFTASHIANRSRRISLANTPSSKPNKRTRPNSGSHVQWLSYPCTKRVPWRL